MRPRLRLTIEVMGPCLAALLTAMAGFAQTYSHARIVRLSFVEGTVTVERPDVSEWSSAPVNTPIQEGFKLSTAEKSFAEVEFENASTTRIGQLSLLEFTQLALSPSGGKLNRLTLYQGYATFNAIPESEDIYELKAGDATFTTYGKTRFRVDLDEGVTRVEVFKGSVEVASPSGSGTLAKNAVLELRPATQEPFKVSQGITKDEWDEWVDQRETAETALRNRPQPGGYTNDVNSLRYGWNDLSNYGNWSYLAGTGYGWFPYAGSGWGPYSNGRWCWYPGFGYTWISGEPWGWLPYHYGQWVSVPNSGWCWIPGNLGAWSPALVTWYQGPGWIGWSPRPGTSTPGGRNACSQAPGCATAVSLNSFLDGKPVTPGGALAVDVSQGHLVANPDIAPNERVKLPGVPQARAAGSSGIAFDPEGRRFVNSPVTGASSIIIGPVAKPGVVSIGSPQGVPQKSASSPIANPTGNPEARTESFLGSGFRSRPSPTAPPTVAPRVASPTRGRSESGQEFHSFRPDSSSPPSRSAASAGMRTGSESVMHSAPTSSPGSFHGGQSGGGGGFSSGGGHSGGGVSGGGGHSSGSTSSGTRH